MPSGREILRDAGVAVEPLADRPAILAEVAPWADEADLLRLDTAVSRLKVELGVTAADVAADADAGPVARAFVAYEAAVGGQRRLDFDDLILRAIAELERDPALLARWRDRCRELLVDEVQDVDRAQLRLALLLAAPANRIFLVGDDDQSIYGWRLADVRRILGLEALLPGLRRVDLEVNYRCPRQVVERAVRLVEHNGERFAKAIRAGPAATRTARPRPGPVGRDGPPRARDPDLAGRRVDAGGAGPHEPGAAPGGRRRAPSRAAVPGAADRAAPRLADGRRPARRGPATSATDGEPLLVTLGRRPRGVRRRPRRRAESPRPSSAGRSATPTWRPSPRPSPRRAPLLAELRRDDAPLTLATAHATKGLEFDHVDRPRHGGRPLPERAGGQPGRRPRPRLRGGASSRLRRVDPGAPLADAALRPGGPLPVPARGVQPGRARAQPRARLSSRMSRSIESRNGSVSDSGQDVADRILDAVGRPAARRRRAQRRRVVVAQPVGQRLEVRDPALGADLAGRGQEPVGVSRGDEPGLVDRRVLVARRPPGRRAAPAPRSSTLSHPPGLVPIASPPSAPGPAARAGAAAGACARSR